MAARRGKTSALAPSVRASPSRCGMAGSRGCRRGSRTRWASPGRGARGLGAAVGMDIRGAQARGACEAGRVKRSLESGVVRHACRGKAGSVLGARACPCRSAWHCGTKSMVTRLDLVARCEAVSVCQRMGGTGNSPELTLKDDSLVPRVECGTLIKQHDRLLWSAVSQGCGGAAVRAQSQASTHGHL